MKPFISKSTIGCGLAVFAGIANAQYTEELASSFDSVSYTHLTLPTIYSV